MRTIRASYPDPFIAKLLPATVFHGIQPDAKTGRRQESQRPYMYSQARSRYGGDRNYQLRISCTVKLLRTSTRSINDVVREIKLILV